MSQTLAGLKTTPLDVQFVSSLVLSLVRLSREYGRFRCLVLSSSMWTVAVGQEESGDGSTEQTLIPRREICSANRRPAGPAPITMTSNWDDFGLVGFGWWKGRSGKWIGSGWESGFKSRKDPNLLLVVLWILVGRRKLGGCAAAAEKWGNWGGLVAGSWEKRGRGVAAIVLGVEKGKEGKFEVEEEVDDPMNETR
ncbi:hypothetical protein LINGRAHAP2_LOCUS29942 [Linum grandiflorum]